MTARQFPDIYYTKPYSWQKGFEQGSWRPSDKNKESPTNPCAKGSVWWEEWQDGFETRKKSLKPKG